MNHVTPTEYARRQTAAEAIIDSQVEAWRQQPSLKGWLKAGSWLAGVLGTAAAVGLASSGPIAAIAYPVLLTLPAICFSAAAWHDAGVLFRVWRKSRRLRRGGT